jgi:hypothetical protein
VPRLYRLAALAILVAPALAAAGPADAPPTAPRPRTLEERVADLERKVSSTKARLADAPETGVAGVPGPIATVVVVHRNEMGPAFHLEALALEVDGARVFAQADAGRGLDHRGDLEIWRGRVPPGDHRLSVELVYRGEGYGATSYAERYRFQVRSSQAFGAVLGQESRIKVVGYEQGGLAAALKDRPAIRYDVEQRAAPAPSAAEAPSDGRR